MRFSKYVIYLLNWDSCAKRIAILILIIELSKHNGFLLSEGERLEDQF